jgi:DNA-binding protein H-NS
MAKTIAQIEAQISKLQKQKDAIRAREVAGVIRRIRKAIDYYGLTAEELGFGPGTRGKAAAGRAARKATRKAAVKYRDGAGNEWSGRGRRPAWFVAALEAGRSREELQVGKKTPA